MRPATFEALEKPFWEGDATCRLASRRQVAPESEEWRQHSTSELSGAFIAPMHAEEAMQQDIRNMQFAM
jgi:hypothetical protein